MATLEKIRAKQGLLFGVIIVALFLFIITMAGDPSDWFRSFQRDKMLKAGNIDVTYQENADYKQRFERSGADVDSLNQAALETLLMQKLLTEQYDELGISVPDSQLAYFIDNSTDPGVYQVVAYLSRVFGLQQPDASRVVSIIKNPALNNLTPDQLDQIAAQIGYRSMQDLWVSVEDAAEKGAQAQIFNGLLEGLFTYNELDAQSAYDDSFKTRNVSYVSSPLSAVQDSTVNVTDADIKALWEQLKPFYQIKEETRMIDYVVVPIVPSQADYEAAEAVVDANLAILQTIAGEEGVNQVSGMDRESGKLTKKDIKDNQLLRAMPDSLIVVEGVYKFPRRGNTFNLVKVTGVETRVDSLNYSMFQTVSAEEADSVVNGLRAGTVTFKGLQAENAQTAADSLWLRLIAINDDETIAKFDKAIASYDAAHKAYLFVDTLSYGDQSVYNVIQINNHRAPVQAVDLEIFSLTVDPSTTTETQLKTDLTNFIATNNTGDKFSANADSLYRKQTAYITPSTPHVGQNQYSKGLKDSRQMIKWAMDAKKGEVSPVFPNTNYYAVATVKDIYDGDFVPYNAEAINDQLRQMVIAQKKAEAIGQKNKSESLEEYAKKLNSRVQTADNFSFASQQFGTLRGNEVYEVVGTAAGGKTGVIYGPMQDNNSVVFLQITEENPVEARPMDVQRDGETFKRQFRFNADNAAAYRDLLLGTRKIDNKSLDFEQGLQK